VAAWNDNRHPSQKPIRYKTHGEIKFTGAALNFYKGKVYFKKDYFCFYLDGNRGLILNFHYFCIFIQKYLKTRMMMKKKCFFALPDGRVTVCEIFGAHGPDDEVDSSEGGI